MTATTQLDYKETTQRTAPLSAGGDGTSSGPDCLSRDSKRDERKHRGESASNHRKF